MTATLLQLGTTIRLELRAARRFRHVLPLTASLLLGAAVWVALPQASRADVCDDCPQDEGAGQEIGGEGGMTGVDGSSQPGQGPNSSQGGGGGSQGGQQGGESDWEGYGSPDENGSIT